MQPLMDLEFFAMWDTELQLQGPALCSGWTLEQNKEFENALALYDQDTPDRWEKVAARLQGKTAMDVERHYRDLVEDVQVIEAGLVAPPYCNNSTSCSMGWIAAQKSGTDLRNLKQCTGAAGAKAGQSGKSSEQERKKGVPWTEEEHRLFLMGLHKYGKGDWRSISRNFVVSRTPTQVASHAQKYFIRLQSGNKDKRRSSIHDITTVNGFDRRSFSLQQPPSNLSRNSYNPSSFPADVLAQSMLFTTYPSTIAIGHIVNSQDSQAECNSNNLIFSHYPLDHLYQQQQQQQRGLSTRTTRNLIPDSSLGISQLGFPAQSALHY